MALGSGFCGDAEPPYRAITLADHPHRPTAPTNRSEGHHACVERSDGGLHCCWRTALADEVVDWYAERNLLKGID
ncbi:hypothetical protein [Prauserella sp. PE36]|uniref:hypothetical protein n=1 Tax=Prauserella sp. PE36 TaxID=1504709 RepID=UPI0011BFA560|nr:hypothetical protein [Prauserella sp. PE36]